MHFTAHRSIKIDGMSFPDRALLSDGAGAFEAMLDTGNSLAGVVLPFACNIGGYEPHTMLDLHLQVRQQRAKRFSWACR
jgi:hypothetical protein